MNWKVYSTGINTIDEPLGGGFYEGSIASVFGDPNIGKSVFCLQMAYKWASEGHKVMYFDTEGMSPQQIMFWDTKFKERYNTDKEPIILNAKSPEKLFDFLGRDFSYEVDKDSGKIGRIAVIKRKVDKRKKDQSDPNILNREDPDIVIVDSFSYIIKTSIGNMTSLLPARADVEAKLLSVFNEWVDKGGKFLLLTNHISRNPTNPQDLGSLEGGSFVHYSSKIIFQVARPTKDLREKYGDDTRRIRFLRKPIMRNGEEYEWIIIRLKQDYGFNNLE